MLITVIGKSYTAIKISDYLAQNQDNIVFTTANSTLANNIDICPNNINEIKDFINANEISLLIIADKNYFSAHYEEVINETECFVLCLENMAQKICTNISSAKKFAYKNKIQTPKFATFEKPNIALEYIQTADFPLVIMPDILNETQVGFIAETREKAKKEVEKLFETDNKKILVENYIQGIKYTKYLISDGITTYNLIDLVSYFDEVITNNTNYINKKAKDKIEKEIIPTLINSFFEEEIEFQGIIGIEFIINNDEVYFIKFKPFFDDIEIDIALETIEDNFLELINMCTSNSLINIEKINTKPIYAISIDNKNEFITTGAKTMSNAIKLAVIEGGDKKIIDEAIKYWER